MSPSDSENRPTAAQTERAPGAERVNRQLLELLVCPITKTTLIYDDARQELISRAARLAFPIRRGVPHMLPSEARPLDDDD
jgi:uncharacterized protein YbaR (Trm112 family)